MADPRPVLTIFAGPNGSGKSSLYGKIFEAGHLRAGPYINADLIARELALEIPAVTAETRESIEQQAFWEADRRREECLKQRVTFTFETVFSHESKVDFMRRARDAGYDVRLYFVSTENSRLNVERVRKRVREGGHDVPTEKVIARYRRSLALLPKACEFVDEATLFDNSGLEMRAVVQFQRDRNGAPHIIIVKPLPRWIVEFLRQILPLIGTLSGRPA